MLGNGFILVGTGCVVRVWNVVAVGLSGGERGHGSLLGLRLLEFWVLVVTFCSCSRQCES